MNAYTCNAFQVLCSLSHFLLLHFLHSDSSCTRFTPLHSCCLVSLQAFAHSHRFSMAFITRPHIASAQINMLHTINTCSLHDSSAILRCIHSVLYRVPAVNVCALLRWLLSLRVRYGFSQPQRQYRIKTSGKHLQ